MLSGITKVLSQVYVLCIRTSFCCQFICFYWFCIADGPLLFTRFTEHEINSLSNGGGIVAVYSLEIRSVERGISAP